MNILIVVDMQNDFIDGALGTKEAENIVPNVVKKIQSFDGKVFFTRDTHQADYMETQEGKNLPVPHCIQGTSGWEIRDELKKYVTIQPIDKPTFGSSELAGILMEENQKEKIDSITLIGLCTDICVISNALLLKAFFPEVPICVQEDCMAGVTPESHRNAIEAMKMCQIEVL